jgi:hypothetical protein
VAEIGFIRYQARLESPLARSVLTLDESRQAHLHHWREVRSKGAVGRKSIPQSAGIIHGQETLEISSSTKPRGPPVPHVKPGISHRRIFIELVEIQDEQANG